MSPAASPLGPHGARSRAGPNRGLEVTNPGGAGGVSMAPASCLPRSSPGDVLVDEFDMLLDAAATVIQAAWRGYQARERLASQRAEEQAAVVIQAYYRGYRVRCEIYNQYVAATTIQAHYRGYRTRQALAERHRAATTIQAQWRGYHTRQALAHGRAVSRRTSRRQTLTQGKELTSAPSP
uniref:Uncharacterized protein n=1 Tax=Chelydra serpentina TaxID=8475 RepID=A0A8C3T6A1_CHESE